MKTALSAEREADLRQKLSQYSPRQVLRAESYQGMGEFWTVLSLKAAVEKWYGLTYGCVALATRGQAGFTNRARLSKASAILRPSLKKSERFQATIP